MTNSLLSAVSRIPSFDQLGNLVNLVSFTGDKEDEIEFKNEAPREEAFFEIKDEDESSSVPFAREDESIRGVSSGWRKWGSPKIDRYPNTSQKKYCADFQKVSEQLAQHLEEPSSVLKFAYDVTAATIAKPLGGDWVLSWRFLLKDRSSIKFLPADSFDVFTGVAVPTNKKLEEWLTKAIDLDKRQEHREATRLVFKNFNSLFKTTKFDEANEQLKLLLPKVGTLTSFLLRSILNITFAAKEKLSVRRQFFERAYQRVKETDPEIVSRLLDNLK